MTNDCPYCSLAKKKGELFCSRHSTSMSTLESGIFFIEEKKFEECDWHVTRLSLNFNLDGSQPYFIGNQEYRVSPKKYLLINEGQSFKTSVSAEDTNRMVTLAFKVGLAEEIYASLIGSDEYLLENPYEKRKDQLCFFEKTYLMDDFLQNKIQSLIHKSPEGNHESYYLNEELENILTHVLHAQKKIHGELSSIKKVKASTRIELYKRLNWSLEYLNNHYQEAISVDQLAKQSCLSSFHFKRLFKEYFKESPYQYIKKLRLQKSSELLLKGFSVNETCKAVGWEDASSFIRLFKKTMSVTPSRYGQQIAS